jgi:L-lactate dehydrogenase complex protein LldG
MSASSGSREQVLGRVRRATEDGAADVAGSYARLERKYVRAGRLGADERLALMIERLREYDAEVVETTPVGLAGAIAEQLKASGRHSYVVPAGLPAEWMAAGFEWKVDGGLTTAEIETADGVVTGAFCGIADSGTIVLHHSDMEGRRVISLLPDWHLCVLRASDVVETLPEYFARCGEDARCAGAPRLATYISGPSATADIEMTRIKGVHGPRFLHVVVVRD